MKRLVAATILVALAAVTLSACTDGFVAVPGCEPSDAALVLMAQSVPDAALVPCVDELPAGWGVQRVDIRSGGSTMAFGIDRLGGEQVLEVSLLPSCDVSEAVEVPSDELDTARFEDVHSLTHGLSATRTYTFAGGCVQYAFTLPDTGWTTVLNDATLALSFVSRDALVTAVRDDSLGVIQDL